MEQNSAHQDHTPKWWTPIDYPRNIVLPHLSILMCFSIIFL